MHSLLRPTGIQSVGNVPWGAHFCQFYRTESDLADILVPYFLAGLRANESCLWVTSDKLPAERAAALLRQVEPDLDSYIERGQLEIVSINDWYSPGDAFDGDAVLAGWVEREERSRAMGFSGLRLTGDTIWVERSGWADFMDYEGKVNGVFGSRNMVALCTYCLDSCSAEDVIEVCHHHEFALSRRNGRWEQLESAALRTAKEQLRVANTDLEERVLERTAELNTALRAREEFLAMLGHELRNPLAPIRVATDLILQKAPRDEIVSHSALILDRQVGHLTRLVDDLLDVARISKGQIRLQLEVLPLAQVLTLAAEQARPLMAQRQHEFIFSPPQKHLRVRCDLNRMAQVFGNLLHNAAKYTPPGGTISLLTHKEGGEVVVCVRDNGSGIPADMLHAIFGLFTQLPRSLDRADGGLGIGLTLAKRLTEMQNGTIRARSEGLGRGSEFSVRLPCIEDELSQQSQQRRLLVVDDNVDITQAFQALLTIYGFEVRTANSSQQALSLAAEFEPHVALLDISLSSSDGYTLAQQLRSRCPTTLQIIGMSGYSPSNGPSHKDVALDAFLVKPVTVEDFLGVIENPSFHNA